MKKSRKILIIGNKLHGKTTLANFMVEALGDAEGYSTSSYLVYRLSLIHGVSEEEILKEKEKYRPELIELGNAMCDADAGCLVSICLWSSSKEFILVDGVRRVSEYDRIKDWFDLVLWVDRPGQAGGLDNLELEEKHADRVVLNDGSLEDLKKVAENISKEIREN
jgi:hypothetical protein